MSTDQTPDTEPTRRRVYYISGFDPRGARFYHQLYRSEAAKQEAINGYRYEVGKRQKTGEHTSNWQIRATPSAPDAKTVETHTSYTFLGWDDLIRENWITSQAQVLARMPAYYAHYLSNGGMRKALASTPRGFTTLVAPFFYALVTLLLAALVGSAIAWLAAWLVQTQNHWFTGLVGLAVAVAVIKGAVMLAEKNRLFWMMRILLFVMHWGRSNPPELERRWNQFADIIHADNLQHPDDEVLIIGHSVGGLAAITVAERYLALQPQPFKPDSVKLLVLGNLTPLMGVLPQAGWFRDKLVTLGQSGLPWFDYSAAADPLCCRLVDPFALCALPPATAAYKIRSARFHRMFSTADFKRRSRDGFAIHFQYLMATHLPVDNDFFSLTAGPVATSPLNPDHKEA
ncbi:MAG: hypothetical protein V4772_01580 [Pseudomonadota bacterium]